MLRSQDTRMRRNNDFEHAMKNLMAIVLGYTDLLLDDCAPGDQRRLDLLEIRKAANDAVALVDNRPVAAR